MNPGHEEIQEMLPAAALEILEHAELQRLVIHIGECTECARLLREYRDTAARLALLAPAGGLERARVEVVRKRLMARVAAGQGARRSRVNQWTGWLVAASLAGLLLMHHSVHRTLDYGYFLAGLLTLALIGLGVYARRQQRRAAELQRTLDRS